MPRTHTVRAKIGYVAYSRISHNQFGDEVPELVYAHGPGMVQNDPAAQGLEEGSEEYQTALDNFRLGEKIEVMDDDYLRLKGAGAVVDEEEAQAQAEAEEEEEVLDVSTASADDLARWIDSEKPTVNQVVQASGGDPDVARKLLEAESKAQDGEPRKGVVDGLTAVIQRGGE